MSHKVAYGSVWVGLFLHLRHWDRQKKINTAAKELISKIKILSLFSLFSPPSSQPRTPQLGFWAALEAIEICHIILFYINNSSNHTAKISVPSRLFDFGEGI